MSVDCWTDEERKGLILSIGGGRHDRPLSPGQVAELLERAIRAGASTRAIADSVHLEATTMIGRFLSLRRLPRRLQEQVSWGRSAGSLNLTQAQEIARLDSDVDQMSLAEAVVEDRLTASEVRAVVQLVANSGDTLPRALEKTLALRPTLERRYITIGQVQDPWLRGELDALAPSKRTELLRSVLSFATTSASLSPSHFTVATSDPLQMSADQLEQEVNVALANVLGGS